mmetsp:Transcript_68484/g.149576  ORF Transcript_68484/g.149576 Transcript_68484/m.149576 type:complete len:210 (+) Transcript_68484:46-675(+)
MPAPGAGTTASISLLVCGSLFGGWWTLRPNEAELAAPNVTESLAQVTAEEPPPPNVAASWFGVSLQPQQEQQQHAGQQQWQQGRQTRPSRSCCCCCSRRRLWLRRSWWRWLQWWPLQSQPPSQPPASSSPAFAAALPSTFGGRSPRPSTEQGAVVSCSVLQSAWQLRQGSLLPQGSISRFSTGSLQGLAPVCATAAPTGRGQLRNLRRR